MAAREAASPGDRPRARVRARAGGLAPHVHVRSHVDARARGRGRRRLPHPLEGRRRHLHRGVVVNAATQPHRIRVLIADDHEPTRRDVRRTLERDGRFDVCGEAADAAAAVSLALRRHPDLVLLDVSMPGDGLSALWEITARLPGTRVLMLTVSEDDEHLFAALRGGASGYLLKDIDPRRLPEALYDVHLGR